jgi:hypothetical protein
VKVRKCRFCTTEAQRVASLVERVISCSLRTNPARPKPTRSGVLRALLQVGLRLADTREISREHPTEKNPRVALSYRISDEETHRLESMRDELIRRSLFGAEPELAEVERMIIRLALDEAETRKVFPAFVLVVWGASNSSSCAPGGAKPSA